MPCCGRKFYGLGYRETNDEDYVKVIFKIENFTKGKTEENKSVEVNSKPSESFLKKLKIFRTKLQTMKLKETKTVKHKEVKFECSKEEMGVCCTERIPDSKDYKDTSGYDYKKVFKVLVVGTSITDQALDTKHLQTTTINVKKVKAFTICSEDGEKDPDKNVEDVVEKELWNGIYDVLIIEVGANEISNLSKAKDEDMFDKVGVKINKLVELCEKFNQMTGGEMKIVLLKQVKRMDGLLKIKLAKQMDQELLNKVKGKDIIVQSLEMKCETRKEKKLIFGEDGDRNEVGRLTDGLHLRGVEGQKRFTAAYSKLIKSVILK